MKQMIKTTLITSITLACLTTLQAKDTKMLPMMDADYCAGWGFALLGGYGEADTTGAEGSLRYGVEASLACPMLQLEAGDIRQQISIVYGEDNGLTTTQIEAAPFFMFDVAKTAQIGLGPVFGVSFANLDTVGTDSAVVFGAGAGVNFNYDISAKMFIGADARYLWTGDADFGTGKVNLTNYRSMLKVGMHF